MQQQPLTPAVRRAVRSWPHLHKLQRTRGFAGFNCWYASRRYFSPALSTSHILFNAGTKSGRTHRFLPMKFLSRLHAQVRSCWQGTHLPADKITTAPIFHPLYEFDETRGRWCPVEPIRPTASAFDSDNMSTSQDAQALNLVTWNVDYSSPLPVARFSAIVSRILGLTPAVDIIFLQEVSPEALSSMFRNPTLRKGWVLSDPDRSLPAGQPFTTVTLLSKARFRQENPTELLKGEALGPVWRVAYPSRYGRDALCCDIFIPTSPASPPARVRLINVHLDSLPVQPSRRPQQISIVADLLRSAGRGLIAGDFNPVLPEDDALIRDNGLVDGWVELHPEEPGFTWGNDGKQPFPPSRLDKIAVVGVELQSIEILDPGSIARSSPDAAQTHGKEHAVEESIPWSDHCGLRCSFKLVGMD